MNSARARCDNHSKFISQNSCFFFFFQIFACDFDLLVNLPSAFTAGNQCFDFVCFFFSYVMYCIIYFRFCGIFGKRKSADISNANADKNEKTGETNDKQEISTFRRYLPQVKSHTKKFN